MFDFLLDFDRDFYNFNRSIKDMSPYQIKRYKDHTTLVHNVVGIKKEDLHINLEPDRNTTYLVITGETKNDVLGSTYNVNSRFSVNKDEVSKVEWEVKDGLLYVDIFYKEPEKVNIEIKER